MLKILLDSNVLISAYPKPGDKVPELSLASAFLQFANEHGHTTYHHPVVTEYDFANVRDPTEREWRRQVTENHPVLPNPPGIHAQVAAHCGNPLQGSNDWVDNYLLSAVVGNAVSLLVTEDRNLHKKAKRLSLGERVATIEDALAHLKVIAPKSTHIGLFAREAFSHELDTSDLIFASLREDYPGFEGWLHKCQMEHRKCWIIESGGDLAALTIVKWEDPPEFGPGGKTLKICLFKVSEQHPGMRYGELLLKSVFDYSYVNRSDSAYVTVFPKYNHVATFLENFGFVDAGKQTSLGEMVRVKSLRPDRQTLSQPSPLDYHIKYGPWYYSTDSCVQRFIIPIKPKYHHVLFPEVGEQSQIRGLGTLSPSGNGIQKAYLSRSVTRQIQPGDILYFYRSHDWRRLSVVGVVEDTTVARTSDELSAYVGKRSVYSQEDISALTQRDTKDVLAILFRYARDLRTVQIDGQLNDDCLKGAQVWQAPPQSIMKVQPIGARWLDAKIDKADMKEP